MQCTVVLLNTMRMNGDVGRSTPKSTIGSRRVRVRVRVVSCRLPRGVVVVVVAPGNRGKRNYMFTHFIDLRSIPRHTRATRVYVDGVGIDDDATSIKLIPCYVPILCMYISLL